MPLYSVRVFKSLVSQPTVKWANSYEMFTSAPMESGDIVQVSDELVAAERGLHLNIIRIDRVVTSTWVPDSWPYNPDNLKTVEYAELGLVSPVTDEREALDTVLFVKRLADFGRSGKLFYRGCLLDAQVDTNSGELALTSAAISALNTRVAGFKTALATTLPLMVMAGKSLINKVYKAAAQGEKQEVEYVRQTEPHIRPVVDFRLGGVRRVQLGHKYFDKEN